MASKFSAHKRQLVPRWRLSSDQGVLKELSVGARNELRTITADDIISDKLEIWLQRDDLHSATDLLSTAVLSGDQTAEILDAATFVLRSPMSSREAKIVAQVVQSGGNSNRSEFIPAILRKMGDADYYADLIRSSRRNIRVDPRDSLAWADLSLSFASLGIIKKSIRAMEIARLLSPNNRFIIRSASRLFMHVNDSGKSLHILRSANNIVSDPWLLSAEIAITNRIGQSSKLIKRAKQLLKSGNLPPFMTSELQGAIATIEVDSGNIRPAKKLFYDSIIDPTENTLAQIGWLQSNQKIFIDPARLIPLKDRTGGEARAYEFSESGRWREAVNESLLWIANESFSAAPYIHASYLAAVGLEDHASAIKIATRGAKINPSSFGLANNLAYSLIMSGQLDDAEEYLTKYLSSVGADVDEPSLSATAGLLAYRRGNKKEGRFLYEKAINDFRLAKHKLSGYLATLFYGIERIRSGDYETEDSVIRSTIIKVSSFLDQSKSDQNYADLRLVHQRLITAAREVKISS